jgi:hypothetical protein
LDGFVNALDAYQLRFSVSVATPNWTMMSPLRSAGSASPRFSFHSRIRAASSGLMMIRAFEPPMKRWRFSDIPVHVCAFTTSSSD